MIPPGSGMIELHQKTGGVFYLNPSTIERFRFDESRACTLLLIQGDVSGLEVLETPAEILQALTDVGGVR